MLQTDIAWAAGFIDGEGCIGIYAQYPLLRNVPSYFTVLEAVNTDVRPLQKLADIFGGRVTIKYAGGGEHATSFRWRLSGPSAAETAKLLLPYLMSKREQAEIIIAFQNTVSKKKLRILPESVIMERAELHSRSSLLNTTGPGRKRA